MSMRIITKSRITAYYQEHPDAKIPLEVWVSRIKELEIKTLNELKQIANSVDVMGNNRVIFNIGENKHRLITVGLVRNQTIYIRWLGTHAEYDKIDAHSI